jgi:hypothetical protein
MEKACTGFDAPSYDAAVTAAITLSKVGADLARIWRGSGGQSKAHGRPLQPQNALWSHP